MKRTLRLTLAALLTLASLAACAPRTEETQPTPAPTETEPEAGENTITLTDPVALEVDRVAREAYHLMELEYLETGRYSPDVLLRELEQPRGVQWLVEDISETSYRLRITSDQLPEVAWFVSPEGVVARQVEQARIF